MNRRELFSNSSKVLLASYLLSSSRDASAQGSALTPEETAWDNKRKRLIDKLTDAKPYALVVNMNFDGVVPLTSTEFASKVNGLNYVTTEHVPYFAQLAQGKIAPYQLKGTSRVEERIPPVGEVTTTPWANASQLNKYTKGYFISVRKTGAESLTRIRAMYPTKPHAILDKTLKPKSLGELNRFLLDLEANYIDNKLFLEATPAHVAKTSTTNPTKLHPLLAGGQGLNGKLMAAYLKQIWDKAKLGDTSCPYSGLVGWWVTVTQEVVNNGKTERVALNHTDEVILDPDNKSKKKKRTMKVPLGFLRVGDIDLTTGQALTSTGVPVPFDNALTKQITIPPDAYTGDYDLHDVYYGSEESGFQRRPFLSTTNTDVAKATFKGTPGEDEYITFARLLNWSIQRRRGVATDIAKPGAADDGFANMVQHGSQNVYYAFVLALNDKIKKGKIPGHEAEKLVESLLSWDTGGIIFFTPDRIAYVFTNDPFMPASASSAPRNYLEVKKSVIESNAAAKQADDKLIPLLKSFHRIYNLHKCREAGDFQIWSSNKLIERISTNTQ